MIRFESEHTPVPHLVPACSGVVLELGPGAGNQLFRFDKAKVTRIVGVESNPLFAPDLQRQIRANGLEGVYDVIVPARFGEDDAAADEELARQGIVPGSVDTVLSVQVLCSVSDPQRAMREVYRLLKPGGRFIFWEHTRSEDLVTRVVQYLWNPLWTRVIGGCRLTRDTRSVIESAGEWKNIESIESDELPWSMVPRMWGVLVKPEPS
ncbi:methyltransferase-like protein 7B [Achaetomium macrosporum]|uniref:Methyltransferase-like protein 7B n=1 Tax=Achaetomium macrosporum TaxID=79813 RepID=A0AAN7CB52_9PEZI|nr:methyltransferase-like protein 7B [Achaetomium macrosporum]